MKFFKVFKKIIKLPLVPLVCIYGLVLRLRIKAYKLGIFDVYQSGIPIVSVGNIALGGQGKTPLTDYIANIYTRMGKTVHISMRGHKGALVKKGGFLAIPENKSPNLNANDAKLYGDEAIVHYYNIPKGSITLGKNRWKQLLNFLNKTEYVFPDVIIMDDGFQHLKIEKNLNIVLLHTNVALEDYQLYPLGKLRDLVSSLAMADFLCINHGTHFNPEKLASLLAFLKKQGIVKEVFNLTTVVTLRSKSWMELEEENIIAISALANNQQFFDTLTNMNIHPKQTLGFADHFAYPKKMMDDLFIKYPLDQYYYITTQKDYYKIKDYFSSNLNRLLCVQLTMELVNVDEQTRFHHKLSLLNS